MKLKSTLIVLSLVAAPAFASDQAVSKTREQVRAELAQAQRSGDMLAFGESGLTLKQINPGAYPVATSTQVGKSREQVRDELEQAIRTGDIMVAGEFGVKRNELMSGRYPTVASKSLKTRDQVKSELARAIREGEERRLGPVHVRTSMPGKSACIATHRPKENMSVGASEASARCEPQLGSLRHRQ